MAEDSDRFELEQRSTSTGEKTRIILRNDHVIVGRNPDAGVPVNSLLVSRRHAFLRKGVNSWALVDNESANGVYLQGKKIIPNRPYVLKEGQMFCLAEPANAEHVFVFKRFTESESSSSQGSAEITLEIKNGVVTTPGKRRAISNKSLALQNSRKKQHMESESSSSQGSAEILLEIKNGAVTTPGKRRAILNKSLALPNSQKKQHILQENPNEIDVTESFSPALSQRIRNTISNTVKKKIESAPESCVKIEDCMESDTGNSSTKRKFFRLSMSSQKKKPKRCLTKVFENNPSNDAAKSGIELIDLTVTNENASKDGNQQSSMPNRRNEPIKISEKQKDKGKKPFYRNPFPNGAGTSSSVFNKSTEEKNKPSSSDIQRFDLIQTIYEKDAQLQLTKRELERKNKEIQELQTNFQKAEKENKRLKNDLKMAKTEAEDTKRVLQKTEEAIDAIVQVEVEQAEEMSNNRTLSIDDFECSICLQPVNRATVLSCGHMFCRGCISLWEEQNKNKVCPYCKQKFDTATYVRLIESLMEKIMTAHQREEKHEAMKKHDEKFSEHLELKRKAATHVPLRSATTDSSRTMLEIVVSSEDERRNILKCIAEMMISLLMRRASNVVPSIYYTIPLNSRLIINDFIERLRLQLVYTQISVRLSTEPSSSSSRNENYAHNFNPFLPGPSNVQHGPCYHCNEYGHDSTNCPYRQH